MTSQEGSSVLKSCARRSFSFTCGNLQGFATHPHSLGDPLLGRDPWFEKHWIKVMYCLKYASNGCNSIGGKLADVTLNCQSFKHIFILGFFKFLLYLLPLVHQCLN